MLQKKLVEKKSPASKIEFYRHNLNQEDHQKVLSVLQSLFLTTGSITSEFEKKLACYLGLSYSVGVMSCTHALELALRFFNISVGDEVITTPMSFVATANVIEMVGATPVFADVELDTGNIDITRIEALITPRTKAIIPVHLYGQMVDMVALSALAKKYNLKVIEDAAHCLEGVRDGIRPGQLSDAVCLSFYATKNLTSGEGGALCTNDEAMYQWVRSARSHGIDSDASDRYFKLYKHYDMKFLGLKCNMSDIQAALLINQIDRVDEQLEKRESLANLYRMMLNKNSDIVVLNTRSFTKHAQHLFTVLVPAQRRDFILNELQMWGVGVAVNYRPIHLMSYYSEKYGYKKGDFPNAEMIGSSTISLPLYPSLRTEDVQYIVNALISIVES